MTYSPKHADSISSEDFDTSLGEVQAEINDAARALHTMWEALPVDDEPGAGGPRDHAMALITILSGDADEDTTAYALALFKAAANQMIDDTPMLRHWI